MSNYAQNKSVVTYAPNSVKYFFALYKEPLGNHYPVPRRSQGHPTCLTLMMVKFKGGKSLVRDRNSKSRHVVRVTLTA